MPLCNRLLPLGKRSRRGLVSSRLLAAPACADRFLLRQAIAYGTSVADRTLCGIPGYFV
ncbi:MAG: hypothetical protein F6K47_39895 [Symploca sp. SIO2E6]|nr:hypothetical protein [Symploca sp. SIO2E6]